MAPRALRPAISIAVKAASILPLKWIRALSGTNLVVPYYHMVSDAPVAHVSHLYRFRTVAEFTADVEFLSRHFEPVSLGDIVEALNGQRVLSRPCFHLTFDDGFREMHDVVAPILQRAGAPATFFLNTAFLDGGGMAHHNVISLVLDKLTTAGKSLTEATQRRIESLLPASLEPNRTLRERLLAIPYAQRAVLGPIAEALEIDLNEYIEVNQPYLTSAQVQALINAGFSIGAHSHDHPLYRDLSLADQVSQTRISIELLQGKFGLTTKAFAFPHTDTGVKDAFFSTVFSERLIDVSFGTGGLVPHSCPRNIERVSMEKTSVSAREILARQFARATRFRLKVGNRRAQVNQPVASVV